MKQRVATAFFAALLGFGPAIAWADETATMLRGMHRINEVVIRAAELAQNRSERDDVRAYGKRLEMDHRFADARVLELAAKLGVSATAAAPALDQADREAKQRKHLSDRLTELERMRGAEFDRSFVQLMRVIHAHEIDSLSTAERGSSPELAGMLDSQLPILEQNMELAAHLTGTDGARAEVQQ